MALTTTQVSQLYVALFGRASEGEGNKNWVNHDKNMIDTAALMLDTDAAKNYFGEAGQTNNGFVKVIYENTLGFINEADIAAWAANLDNGMSRAELVTLLLEEALSSKYAGSAPQEQLLNRIEVSDYMANNVETVAAENVESTQFLSVAHPNGKLNVTDDKSTVSSAESAIDEMSGGAVIDGETFSLTEGKDVFVGTAKNDKVIATNKTLNPDDVIMDGSTTDNDVLELTTTASILSTPSITNIENINVEVSKVGGFELNTDGITGAKTIKVVRKDALDGTVDGTGSVKVTNVSSSASVKAGDKVDNIEVNFAANGNKVGESTIDGGTGTVTVTNINKGGVVINSAASKNVTANKETGSSDTKATVNTSGTLTLTSDVKDLTINAKDSATITLAGATATDNLVLAGDKDLTVKMTAAQIDSKTVKNSNTAKTTIELKTPGDANLKNVENVGRVILDGNFNANTITVNSDQLIATKDAQTQLTIETAGDDRKGTAKFATLDNGTSTDVVVTELIFGNVTLGSEKRFAEVQLDASDDKLEVKTLTLNTADLLLLGTKDMNLGSAAAVIAKTITSVSTGNITLKAGAGLGTTKEQAIVLGAGNDKVEVTDAATIYTANLGAGDNTLTITAAADDSAFVTGAGKDTVTVATVNKISVNTGAGDDIIKLGVAAKATINGGDGKDTLQITANSSLDADAKITNIEVIDLGANSLTVTAKQFLDFNAVELKGTNATTSFVKVTGSATEASTIDASGLVINLGANLHTELTAGAAGATITGSKGADIMTGATGVDTFVFSSGSGNTDTIIDQIASFGSTDKIKTGTAGTSSNFKEIAAVADYANSKVAANTYLDSIKEDGKVGYFYAFGVTDAGSALGATNNDGALFIDWNGDGVADQTIVIAGGATTGSLVAADIIA